MSITYGDLVEELPAKRKKITRKRPSSGTSRRGISKRSNRRLSYRK